VKINEKFGANLHKLTERATKKGVKNLREKKNLK